MDGVFLLARPMAADARGVFTETFRRSAIQALCPNLDFVQDNLSRSVKAGTIRGLHYQTAPHAQAKLVTVLAGSVLDVVVDLRRSSPTFGRHLAVTLSAEAGECLLVPVGLAHGFCTLEPDTLVSYKVSAYYAPAAERGVAWSDPALGVSWPVDPASAILSEKDAALPTLADQADLFD